METLQEIQSAITWGRRAIREMETNDEKVPAFMYERLLELVDRAMALKQKMDIMED